VARLAPTALPRVRSASNGTNPAPAVAHPRARATKRNLPLVALGVLLVVGCAIGFSSAWLRAGGRQQVLVVSSAVSAGQVLSPSDLQVAQLSVGSGLSPVPASQESTLLTETDLGAGADPPAGQAVVGLAVKPGQYPPDVTAGDRVLVVTNPASTITSGATSTGSTDAATSGVTSPVPATVVGVQSSSATNSDTAVVSIQVAEGDAAGIATAASAGDIALVVVSPRSNS